MKYLQILIFLLLSLPLYGQFRMVGNGSWVTLNDSTYSSTVTFQADLTGMGYLATQIVDTFRVFTGTEQNYRISGVANQTFSSADLVIVERGGDWGTPVGQVMVYDPDGVESIPEVPFGSTGSTAQLQAAIGTHNGAIAGVANLGADGNGIISALPLGSVSINALNNSWDITGLGGLDFEASGLGDFKFTAGDDFWVLTDGANDEMRFDADNWYLAYNDGSRYDLDQGYFQIHLGGGLIPQLEMWPDSVRFFDNYYLPEAAPTSDGSDYVIVWNNGVPSWTLNLPTHVHAAADITSGTFADARVAESNVTQHEAAINHDALLNFDLGEHRIINDIGTSATELWSASKINTELSGKAAAAHTHPTSDVVSGTFADARIAQSNVTQHEGAIDHDALTNFAVGEHRIINDLAASSIELWSASKINTELSGKAASSHTHATSDVTTGTFADARIAQTNVTQHEGAINHDNLTGFVANEHRDATTGDWAGTFDGQEGTYYSTITNQSATNWRVFYSNGAGAVTELALGASGTFLRSNGATSIPSFATPAGSGDVSKVGTPVNNQIGVWTGDGTIEGDANFTWDGTNIVFGTGSRIGTGTTATNTLLLSAYDVDGASYTTFGTLTANNTPTFDLSTEVTIGGSLIASAGGAFHDGFSDFVGSEHVDHTSVTFTAGTGLTGGGTIAANRTFDIDVENLSAVTTGGHATQDQLIVSDNGTEVRMTFHDAFSLGTKTQTQATTTLDFENTLMGAIHVDLNLTATLTYTSVTGGMDGSTYVIRITEPNASNTTITWPANVYLDNDTAAGAETYTKAQIIPITYDANNSRYYIPAGK